LVKSGRVGLPWCYKRFCGCDCHSGGLWSLCLGFGVRQAGPAPTRAGGRVPGTPPKRSPRWAFPPSVRPSPLLPSRVFPAVQQVAFADRILLNKTDLVTKADLALVKRRIRVRLTGRRRAPGPSPTRTGLCLLLSAPGCRFLSCSCPAKRRRPPPGGGGARCPQTARPSSPPRPPSRQAITPGADIIECSFAKVDLDRVLGIHAFSLDRLLLKDPEFLVGGESRLQPLRMGAGAWVWRS
jgi:hypothetical protein